MEAIAKIDEITKQSSQPRLPATESLKIIIEVDTDSVSSDDPRPPSPPPSPKTTDIHAAKTAGPCATIPGANGVNKHDVHTQDVKFVPSSPSLRVVQKAIKLDLLYSPPPQTPVVLVSMRKTIKTDSDNESNDDDETNVFNSDKLQILAYE